MTDQKLPKNYHRQLELEREMQGMGIARFREEVQKAKENGMESTTSGVLRIMNEAFVPFEKAIRDWKDKCEEGSVVGGRPSVVYPLIKHMKPEILAFLTMKTIMDNISKARNMQEVTIKIGTQIQNEINFKEFKKESPHHYEKVKKDVKRRSKSLQHISTVLKLSAKKDEVDMTQFTPSQKHQVGSDMLSMFIESTGLVELHSPPQMPGSKKRKAMQVHPTESTIEWLKTQNSRCELLSPVYMPMVAEPKDWSKSTGGGFWSEHINIPLVRRAGIISLDEINNTDVWEVYQALNHLQKTKWSINKKVLQVMDTCVANKLPLGKLPTSEKIPLPPLPVDIEENEEARWLWRKHASVVYGQNIRAMSKFISLHKKLQIAERFSEEEEIYFVYNTDFRGRIYPVQVHLNPQGDDVCKSLLQFAEGKPLDDETGAWLALHGANIFGYDKASLQDRVQWTLENQDDIIASAKDPLRHTWWTEADKPWQFLAFCIEWEEFDRDPDNFKSHLAVALDGSCNGLQNFSAMLRDPVGGKATNLTPTDVPQDIYSEVAKVVNDKLEEDIKNNVDYAICWRGYVSRKLVKRPTMTMPYGATLAGYREQIMDEVQGWRDAGRPAPDFTDSGFNECMYMANLIKKSLGKVVVAAERAMDWLQSVAEVVSKENLPIYWQSPVGFPVMQNYRNILTKQVKTEIAGNYHKVNIAYGSGNKMNNRKMKAAISPNFVHSCDAAHLTRTVGLCDTNGIGSLAMVHDSFGTHAADTPVLRELLRHAFVQIHEMNPLEQFYKQMCEQSSKPELIKTPPSKGDLDLQDVLQSEFFFA